MTQTIVFLVLIVVVIAAIGVVVSLPDPLRASLVGPAEALVRYSAVAGVAVLSTSIMYIAEAEAGSVLAGAVGDAAMVLAAWSMWAGLSALNGRARLAPVAAAVASAVALVVGLTVAERESTLVKLVLVGLGCLVLGAEATAGRVRGHSAGGVLVGVGLGFGSYALARVAVIVVLGDESVVYQRAFSTLASSVVSGVAVIAAIIGVILLYRQLAPAPSKQGDPAIVLAVALQVLSLGRPLTVYRLEVQDAALIRATHGVAAAEAFADALVAAARASYPASQIALSPAGDQLVLIEAERRGAASQTAELVRAFDHAMAGAGLMDLTEVTVRRRITTSHEELREEFLTLSPGRAGAPT